MLEPVPLLTTGALKVTVVEVLAKNPCVPAAWLMFPVPTWPIVRFWAVLAWKPAQDSELLTVTV
jgi:hypothetical protein